MAVLHLAGCCFAAAAPVRDGSKPDGEGISGCRSGNIPDRSFTAAATAPIKRSGKLMIDSSTQAIFAARRISSMEASGTPGQCVWNRIYLEISHFSRILLISSFFKSSSGCFSFSMIFTFLSYSMSYSGHF